jgi:hypothetical protein
MRCPSRTDSVPEQLGQDKPVIMSAIEKTGN